MALSSPTSREAARLATTFCELRHRSIVTASTVILVNNADGWQYHDESNGLTTCSNKVSPYPPFVESVLCHGLRQWIPREISPRPFLRFLSLHDKVDREHDFIKNIVHIPRWEVLCRVDLNRPSTTGSISVVAVIPELEDLPIIAIPCNEMKQCVTILSHCVTILQEFDKTIDDAVSFKASCDWNAAVHEYGLRRIRPSITQWFMFLLFLTETRLIPDSCSGRHQMNAASARGGWILESQRLEPFRWDQLEWSSRNSDNGRPWFAAHWNDFFRSCELACHWIAASLQKMEELPDLDGNGKQTAETAIVEFNLNSKWGHLHSFLRQQGIELPNSGPLEFFRVFDLYAVQFRGKPNPVTGTTLLMPSKIAGVYDKKQYASIRQTFNVAIQKQNQQPNESGEP